MTGSFEHYRMHLCWVKYRLSVILGCSSITCGCSEPTVKTNKFHV